MFSKLSEKNYIISAMLKLFQENTFNYDKAKILSSGKGLIHGTVNALYQAIGWLYWALTAL